MPIESGYSDYKKTTWVEVKLFGKKGTGEPHGMVQHLHKGRFVVASGEMTLETWDGKDGEKRSKVSMVPNAFKVGPRSGEASASPTSQNTPEPPQVHDIPDDDIPF